MFLISISIAIVPNLLAFSRIHYIFQNTPYMFPQIDIFFDKPYINDVSSLVVLPVLYLFLQDICLYAYYSTLLQCWRQSNWMTSEFENPTHVVQIQEMIMRLYLFPDVIHKVSYKPPELRNS